MTFDLLEIWAHMGLLSKLIAGSLVVMAIACAGVAIERMIAFSRSRRRSLQFAKDVKPMLDEWNLTAVPELAESHKGSALARLVGEITVRYNEAIHRADEGVRPSEMAKGEAERAREVLGADLRKGFSILATTGSIAPFIGLLGTVVGIIAAFQGIAASGSGGIAAISAGISEALIETALGLLVAIPAVMVFNYLSQKVNRLELNMNRAAAELLEEMEARDGAQLESKLPEAA
jgi:biopolymer transport protein ExbB